MVKERKGDLLRSDAAIIAHQVNCQGVMGAGVARQNSIEHTSSFAGKIKRNF